MQIDKDIKRARIKADMPATIAVMLTVGIYFYWRYGWIGVLEVYVVSVILVNLAELQFKRMALLQHDRDLCRNVNDD